MSIESSGTVNLCSLFLNQYLVLKTDMLTFSAKSAVIQKEKEKKKKFWKPAWLLQGWNRHDMQTMILSDMA